MPSQTFYQCDVKLDETILSDTRTQEFNSVEQAEKSSRQILACSYFTDTQEKKKLRTHC